MPKKNTVRVKEPVASPREVEPGFLPFWMPKTSMQLTRAVSSTHYLPTKPIHFFDPNEARFNGKKDVNLRCFEVGYLQVFHTQREICLDS